jgi:hypothetical protein
LALFTARTQHTLLATGSALGGGLTVANGQVFFAATMAALMSVPQ